MYADGRSERYRGAGMCTDGRSDMKKEAGTYGRSDR